MKRNGLSDLLLLDYVSTWFIKAADYAHKRKRFSFVATSSICQGEQIGPLFELIFAKGVFLNFAYTPFVWKNSAADIAGVWVTILGFSENKPGGATLYDGEVKSIYPEISPYLIPGPFVPVLSSTVGLFGLPEMTMGSNPIDGKRLILEKDEAEAIVARWPDAKSFIFRYAGGDELIQDEIRYCIWIPDHLKGAALSIDPIRQRVEQCKVYRQTAGRDAKKAASRPHSFCYKTYQNSPAIAVPNSQSSDREYIPAVPIGPDVVINHAAFAIYGDEVYPLSLVSSRIHRVWLETVGGRIGNGFRYAVRVVYNTFPVPRFTEAQLEALTASARKILRTRYAHFPKTIADLYDPNEMPEDLRAAHKENDDLLESMYIGRPFRNDTERLEHLFKLYAARVKQIAKDEASAKASKKKGRADA